MLVANCVSFRLLEVALICMYIHIYIYREIYIYSCAVHTYIHVWSILVVCVAFVFGSCDNACGVCCASRIYV